MAKRKGSGRSGEPEPDFLEVGRVLRPWGVRGEMKVAMLGSRADDLSPGQRVYLGDDRLEYVIRSARGAKDVLIVGMQGCDTPEQAEALRDMTVAIHHGDAAPLGPNEYYHHQIIGLTVIAETGETLGQVESILETGAHDVYVVRGPRGEVLIPARVEFVKQVDLVAGILRVAVLPGMLPDRD